MKIQKVIFTIDDNPHYKGFWSSISKHYKQRFNIMPKLFIIGNNVDVSSYDSSNGEIEVVPAVDNIPTIIQALIGKFYFTKTEPDTIWKVGDLDLYPLQKSHFEDSISNISDDAYVHLNPYAYGSNWRDGINGLAGYFHVAKGKVFEEELKFQNKSFEDVCKEIYNSNRWGIRFYNIQSNVENHKASNDWGWFCCEEMYTGYLLNNSSKLIEVPPVSYNRVDRSNMVYDIQKIKEGFYIDFHSPRPYEQHSDIIEKIIENACIQ